MIDTTFYTTVIDLFNRKGVKFTVDELATSLRMSKRTIYEIHGSKEQIMLESVHVFFRAIKEQERLVMDDADMDHLEKIRRVVSMYPPLQIEYRHIDGLRSTFPKVFQAILDEFERNWDNTFTLFEEAFDRGILRRFDLSILKTILLGVFQSVVDQEESEQQQLIIRCLDFILDGYRLT